MAEGYSPKILTGGEAKSDDEILAAHDKVNRVSGPGLPGADDSPLVIMELLQRLRVRDVMRGHDIISVLRTDTMLHAQRLMKQNNISGVPVVEGKRLFGIISVNDIIKALEGGWINDTCQQLMSTNLVVLEADMPLAFAIKFFQNYTFGRFPVLNKDRDLVGIVSQRDVTRVLMHELTNEIAKLEGKAIATPDAPALLLDAPVHGDAQRPLERGQGGERDKEDAEGRGDRQQDRPPRGGRCVRARDKRLHPFARRVDNVHPRHGEGYGDREGSRAGNKGRRMGMPGRHVHGERLDTLDGLRRGHGPRELEARGGHVRHTVEDTERHYCDVRVQPCKEGVRP